MEQGAETGLPQLSCWGTLWKGCEGRPLPSESAVAPKAAPRPFLGQGLCGFSLHAPPSLYWCPGQPRCPYCPSLDD